MAIWQNNLDGGTNGATITDGNSGGASGNAFAAVTPNVTFSNAQSHSSPLSASIGGSSSANYARMAVSDRDIAIELFVRFSVSHAGDYFLVQTRLGSGTPTVFTLLLNGANQLRLRNNSPAVAENIWTASGSFPLNQWVRIVILVNQGTTSGNGQVRVGYFLGESTTPIEESPWITAQDLRGDEGVITQILFGKISGSSYAGTAHLDDIRVLSGADYTNLLAQNTAPVASAGSDQYVLEGATVNLSGSVVDPDAGDSHSYFWEFLWPASGAPSLSGATTATPSFTAGAEGSIYALQLTVDDGDSADTDTVNISVTPGFGGASNMLAWDGSNWV